MAKLLLIFFSRHTHSIQLIGIFYAPIYMIVILYHIRIQLFLYLRVLSIV
jgi:hypothetical protein